MLVAITIFLATYVVVAVGRLPGLRLDRTGAALIGASLMLACNVLPLQDAYQAVDGNTILLLLGMMIVVAHLRLSGFFRLVNGWMARHTHHPLILLVAIVLVSGLFSAFLVNDTVCLVLTPLVCELVFTLRRNPVPYLLAVALASNIGSTATITGNPQNIMIGSFSHISYGTFTAALAPVAVVGLMITVVLLVCAYPEEFWRGQRLKGEAHTFHYSKPLVIKTVPTIVAMVVVFFLGQPAAKVAIIAGALLLLTCRVKPEKVYREVDWPLLVLFAGLFIVVAGLEKAVLSPELLTYIQRLHLERVPVLSTVAALLSNLVSNVPAVLVLKPFLPPLPHPQRAWLTLAMASTLAGNLTVLGSVANLIVVQHARQQKIEIGFWEYCKVGVPLTVLTILVGILFLQEL